MEEIKKELKNEIGVDTLATLVADKLKEREDYSFESKLAKDFDYISSMIEDSILLSGDYKTRWDNDGKLLINLSEDEVSTLTDQYTDHVVEIYNLDKEMEREKAVDYEVSKLREEEEDEEEL